MASRRQHRANDGRDHRAAEAEDAPKVSGMAMLDLGRCDRALLEALEPGVDVRTAAEWGGLMDGRIELREDGAVAWVPGEYARRFGFIEFLVPTEDVVDIHVASQPSMRGVMDIDLTDARKVAVRVPDPDRWRAELGRASGH